MELGVPQSQLVGFGASGRASEPAESCCPKRGEFYAIVLRRWAGLAEGDGVKNQVARGGGQGVLGVAVSEPGGR